MDDSALWVKEKESHCYRNVCQAARQGVNLTDERRAALLQVLTPDYVMPYFETGRIYKALLANPLYCALDERERRDVRSTFLHTVWGGRAIGVDQELTRMLSGS